MTGRLPSHLAPWAGQFDALDPRCAVALGPFVRALDTLLGGDAHSSGSQGEFDGYDGLSRSGTPERLLMSQWLLAEAAPEEFLRRAAQRELLHLAPARRSPEPRGSIAVLVDTGPSQLGAVRLVQLAALMVAHRRAAARGTGLRLGLLGRKPGDWHEGAELPELLHGWLAARSAVEPDPVDVEAWRDSLDAADEAWVLTGEPLASRLVLPGRHKVLAGRESAWSDKGAAEITVTLGGRTARLALPDPRTGARILRGEGWRRTGAPTPGKALSGGVRRMAFVGAGRQLLLGSGDPAQVMTARVPHKARGDQQYTVRRHTFPAPVLAAGYHGRRLVGLYLSRGTVRAHVVGKPWPTASGFAVPTDELDISEERLTALAHERITPLVVDERHMLCCWDGDWYRFGWDGSAARVTDLVAAIPGGATACREGEALRLPHLGPDAPSFREHHVILGPDSSHARSMAGQVWTLAGPANGTTCRLEKGEQPLGFVLLGGEPRLVTRSAAGHLVRIRGGRRDTVLTKASGTSDAPLVHPVLPLLALRRDDGTVEVFDLESLERVVILRKGLA
ncbi:hypothetical protein ABZ208_06235 [Streptomyces sp. NPDC006208]|uniref:hypothetical protein n=1 Tax=Streptomyces sp. NPDC006208 TaxID=3156734 RepID=UPI0033A7CFD0